MERHAFSDDEATELEFEVPEALREASKRSSPPPPGAAIDARRSKLATRPARTLDPATLPEEYRRPPRRAPRVASTKATLAMGSIPEPTGARVGSRKATLVMGSIPEPSPDERPTTEIRALEIPKTGRTWFDGEKVAGVATPAPPARVATRRRRPPAPGPRTDGTRWIVALVVAIAFAAGVAALVGLG